MDEILPKKQHRSKQSGAKLKKKQKSTSSENPRAFAFQSGQKAERAARRTLDLGEKRLHVPMVDRTSMEPPPIVVAVVGPPEVGKSTLIRDLVKRYTKHNVNEIKGPITVVAGKNRRLTFIECANDINAMIDVAKIADLVLLLIDASFGFEMETFEFLNILQTHGFPKVIGVLTHLDSFKDNKKQKKTKKMLKQRFWTEIYQGAKLFYLSGMINGRYLKNEIHNLSRFISVMKFRPLAWRNSHPYLVVDRVEDLTSAEKIRENNKVDRTISVYGYVRGTNLKPNSKVHIPGAGDQVIKEISLLEDPCPLPDVKNKVTGKKRRTLKEQEKLIYAPMTDVAGILYDKDAVYIDIPERMIRNKEKQSEGEQILEEIANVGGTLDEQMEETGVSMFKGGERVRRRVTFGDEVDETDEEEDEGESDEDEEIDDNEQMDVEGESGEEENEGPHNDDDDLDNEEVLDYGDDDDEDEECNDKWKENFQQMFSKKRVNLMKMVYDEDEARGEEDVEEESEEEELFKKARKVVDEKDQLLDSFKFKFNKEKYFDENELREIGNKFITGKNEEDEEIYGDFEDLEKSNEDEEISENEKMERKREILKKKFDEEFDNKDKIKFDTFYDEMKNEMNQQQQKNIEEFKDLDDQSKIQLLGFSAGMYVRIVIENVTCELIEHFDPCYPMILGGLQMNEESFGFIQTRIKKHRWFNRVLKTNDPLIISLGWRRFQTIPVYSICTDGDRNRMLKYTPEHMHCLATFYGPTCAQNVGFCAFQSVSDVSSQFRVRATGVTLGMNKSTNINKKLKIVGYPIKIHKKTAFIKDMFNSALEVAKFEGAVIKSVSGIRGVIKKAIKSPEGAFRATFEDKILMSDIIFLRTWYPVKPKVFYNPVTSLLLSNKLSWNGMRLSSQVRKDDNIPLKSNSDSIYKKIERVEKRFNSLKIPKKLQADLPFASKPKLTKKKPQKKGYMEKRAVVLESKEKKVNAVMQQLSFIQREKERKQKLKAIEARKKFMQKKQAEMEKEKEKHKNKLKRIFKAQKQKNQ